MTIQFKLIITTVCVTFVLCQNAINNGCIIKLCSMHHHPLLLVKAKFSSVFNLMIPETNSFELKDNETLGVLCLGIFKKYIKTNILFEYTCVNYELKPIVPEVRNFEDLNCLSPLAKTQTTYKMCNQGTIINIGYNVRDFFIPLIESCFDNKTGNVLYTNHTLYGRGLVAKIKNNKRHTFATNNLPENLLNLSDLYNIDHQKKMLEEVLKTNVEEIYFFQNQSLFCSHLSPYADFIFPAMQHRTYFYINTFPQWQSVSVNNWRKIEKKIRKHAKKFKKRLEIYTGTYQILTLPDYNKNEVNIYLDGYKNIPVPKYLWKVVYHPSTKEAIAMVVINNPFLKKIKNNVLICPNVCKKYKWANANYGNIQKGYLFCCDVRNLQNVIKTIPKLDIKGILNYKK